MQQDTPSTYILATNKKYSVRQFVEYSFNEINIEIEWMGKDENEIGINKNNKETIVKVNKKFFRPAEVEILLVMLLKQKKIKLVTRNEFK